jgi:hypothetical protein
VEDGRHVARQIRRIGAGRQVTRGARALEPFTERGFGGLTVRDQRLPHRIGRLAAGEGGMDRQASRRMAWVSQPVSRLGQQLFNHGARRRLSQRGAHVRRGALRIAGERLAEEGFLVAEGGVEARSVDAHGLGQVRQRGPFVAFLPEELQRGLEGLVRVEGAGPSPRRSRVLGFHTD